MNLEELERNLVAQPVRSLQYMLRRLSQRYGFLPELVSDGLFGERTLEAVMLFQRELHPPVTGVVDRDTWRAIRDEWLDLERELAEPRQVRGFPQGVKITAGTQEDYLMPIQAMFQSLSNLFEGVERETINGVHDQTSVRNTKWLQSRANLKETGELDRETWNMLTRLYELFVISQLDQQYRTGQRNATDAAGRG